MGGNAGDKVPADGTYKPLTCNHAAQAFKKEQTFPVCPQCKNHSTRWGQTVKS